MKKDKDKKIKRERSKFARYSILTIKILFTLIVIVGVTGAVGAAIYTKNVLKEIPTVREDSLKTDSSSNMYASDGKTLIWSSSKNKRNYLKYEDIPSQYIDLLLSTEDAEYFEHGGFSPKGLANAGISTIQEKLGRGTARGGSGIEQQLIKLTVFSTSEKDRTIDRKVKELFLSSQLTNNYSKEQTLEYYINKIFMGEFSYGAGTIANTYYNKELSELNTSQLAIIAGLGQAPSAYNLYDDPELVEKRRNQVLNAALENEKITQAEYDKAKATPIDDGLVERYSQVSEIDEVTKRHNAFVSSALAQIDEMGYDMERTPLQIITTLDINAENKVIDILNNDEELFQDDGHQAAVTVVDPNNGHVIAEVGGRNSNQIDGLNRATQRNRSTGSSIKPILDYGPALEYYNWPTNKILDGSPYTYPGTNVTAYDYGGTTHGNSEMKVALRHSYNTPAIRTLDEVGEVRAANFLKNLGIETDQTLQGSTALGLDASATQMASAFSAFANGGTFHPTQYIESITFPDMSKKKISFEPIQAMRESTAYIMTRMLQGVISEDGTMEKGEIEGVAQAAKTGTVGYPPNDIIPSSASMDVWTAGYTKSLSIAVWQGYDTPMEPGNYISQEFTLDNAGLLYREIMKSLSKGLDNSDWEMPDTVTHLGGKGNRANYVANDEPKSETEKELIKPEFNTMENYAPYTSELDNSKLKPKMPIVPTVPKDYKMNEWEAELKKDKETFYKEHEKDKEEAANVE